MFPPFSQFYVSLRVIFLVDFQFYPLCLREPPRVRLQFHNVELLEEVERSRSCQQSRRKRSERKTKVEWPLHWWNLIHLIDSKWSSSDLARHDRFLNGIKTSCWGAQVVEFPSKLRLWMKNIDVLKFFQFLSFQIRSHKSIATTLTSIISDFFLLTFFYSE